MPEVKCGAAATDGEVGHFAFDAAGVVEAAAACAAATGYVGQQRVAPALQALRGEGPRLAAIFAL